MPKKKVKEKLVKHKIVVKKAKISAKEKPIGQVTHFYGEIKVAVIKWKKPIKVGENIRFEGATTDFSQELKSMQYDHKNIASAKKSQEVGVKVKEKVRDGDQVYAA